MARDADAGEMLAYFERNRTFLAATSPAWPADFFTHQFMLGRIGRALDERRQDVSLRLCVFERPGDTRMIGSITFDRIHRGPFQACYLGYALDAELQGRGLMFEALQPAIGYAFDGLKLHRIMANYMPTNARSGALLRRFGFVVEGYARDYLLIDGAWRDHVLTSLTRPG